MTIKSYKDLIVWQRSIELVIEIYQLTKQFPPEEIYGLISQMRRASVSIPSNIAEGSYRGTRKDYVQFLRIAGGSASELQTQLEIAKRLSFNNRLNYNKAEVLLSEVLRMLNTIISKLKPNH
jgi:four helix bundle protein